MTAAAKARAKEKEQEAAANLLKAAAHPATRKPEQEQIPTAQEPPAKRQKGTAPALPVLPDNGHVSSAFDVVADLQPWVAYSLKHYLSNQKLIQADLDLPEIPPLVIASGTADKEALRNYKEEWRPANCKESLQNSKAYEAGGSLFWVSPTAVSAKMPVQTLSLAQLQDLSDLFYVEEATDMVFFPEVLEVSVTRPQDIPPNTYPTALHLVAGHGLVCAWYLRMFKALRDEDWDYVRKLYQAALTTTVRVMVLPTAAECARRSLQMAASLQKRGDALCDGFPSFSLKLAIVAEGIKGKVADVVQALQGMQLDFKGSLINKTMFYAAKDAAAFLSPVALKILGQLDSQFGKDVLSYHYPKLNYIIATCKKHPDPKDLIDFVLSQLLLGLQTGSIEDPAHVKLEMLKGKEEEESGFVAIAMTKFKVLQHAVQMAVCMKEQGCWVKKMTRLCQGDAFRSGLAIKAAEAELPLSDESLLPGLLSETEQDSVGKAEAFVTLILACLHGDHDESLQSLIQEENPAQAAMDANGNVFGEAYTLALKDIDDAANEKDQAALPLRVLARMSSDPSRQKDDMETLRSMAEQERQAVFQKAKEAKKKLCSLTVCPKSISAASLRTVFEKTAAFCFQGTLNDSHRAFVLCADQEAEPAGAWAAPVALAGLALKNFQAKVDFVKAVNGAADFWLLFDGRRKENRSVIEGAAGPGTETAEMWLTYSGSVQRAPGRQVFAGNNNREIGLVRLPCGRVRLTTADREDDYTPTEACTTADMAYVNIPPVPLDKLPVMTWEEKKAMTGLEERSGPKNWTKASFPFAWQQVKPVAFWKALIANYNIKQVVDLTPAGGFLGMACLEADIKYLAFCGTDGHRNFLDNLFTKHSMSLITQEGHSLFQQSLAQLIQQLFQEVVAEDKNADDEAEDGEENKGMDKGEDEHGEGEEGDA